MPLATSRRADVAEAETSETSAADKAQQEQDGQQGEDHIDHKRERRRQRNALDHEIQDRDLRCGENATELLRLLRAGRDSGSETPRSRSGFIRPELASGVSEDQGATLTRFGVLASRRRFCASTFSAAAALALCYRYGNLSTN